VCWVALKSKVSDVFGLDSNPGGGERSGCSPLTSKSNSTETHTLTAQSLRNNSFTISSIDGGNKLAYSRHFLDRAKVDFGGKFSSRKV
jgi:hypothetical protein